MDPHKKHLLLLAGIGVVVLYLFSRAKKPGGTARAAAAVDPLQAVAQQLTAQRQQQRAQLDYSAAAVAQQEANTLSEFGFFKQLAADPAYACPNGGRPRWIVGQGPGCIEKRTGAITFGSVLNDALGGYKTYLGFKSQSQGGRGQSGGGSGGNGGGGQYNGSYPDVRF